MKTSGNSPKKEDVKQASNIIAIMSIAGLVTCFWIAVQGKANIPIFLYAIFGGGIIGTDNILKLIKTVFRVGNNNE